MFDFLNFKLLPRVVCGSPVTDHYEAENLISSQVDKKSRGFIAYPSIKPPIEIEFQFLCPVNIHYILINSTVGSQKCSGIEVLAKTDSLPFTIIGRAIYDAPKVCFCNSRIYSKTNPPIEENSNPNFHLGFFKSNTFKCFLNASAIKILIFRTEKSVPCLASVEVWGTPSKSCSSTTLQTINRLMNKSMGTNESAIEDANKVECKNNDGEFRVPEDFKDALTEEIMTIPMTLPCGKSIDQVTLEKHIQSEKSFGRKPCDPFTGVKFTDSIKPVLNVALKSRIDMFVIQNSHRPETYTLKRTLGSRKCFATPEDENCTNKRPKNNVCNDQTPSGSSNVESVGCCHCKGVNNLIFLYLLPCKHYLCRSCLLIVCSNEGLLCPLCSRQFSKGDIKKVNL